MSKREAETIQSLKVSLKENGYYVGAPFDIRPEPSRLQDADVVRAIAVFAPKFDVYQAPVEENATKGAATDAAKSTRLWLRQFDTNDDVECAVKVLGSIRMLTRADTVDAVSTFIRKNPSFSGALVIPFGSARDSGAIHGYFAGDLHGGLVSECLTLDEAFKKHKGRPIIFLDDFIGSGGQSRDILAAGFGRDDLRAELGEDRNLFSSEIQSFLQESNPAFVFTAAWDDGLDEIKKITSTLGVSATIYHHIGESEIPFVEGALSDLPRWQTEAFIDQSRLIGVELLASVSERKSNETEQAFKDRLAKRALGYGNRGMLLASPFNVPTQTFTPLWASGTVAGVQWAPLLPRRKKR